MRGAGTVFGKEVRETIRDRRTLMMMIVLPVLLYPLLLVVIEQFALFGARQMEAEAARVELMGEVPPEMRAFLASDAEIDLVDDAPEPGAPPADAIRGGTVDAAVVLGPAAATEETRDVVVVFNRADDRSVRARDLLSRRLLAWGDTLLERRLVGRDLPPGFVRPLAVADTSIARAEEVGGYALGRFLPVLLILMTLLGTFYPAIDMAAGEKERGTLETLLTAPVSSRDVVMGKFAAVALVGVVAAGLNLGSMLLTFQSGLFQITRTLDVEFSIPLRAVALIFVTLVPLAILFGALFLGIAVRSRSFKEAQNSLTPVYVATMVPAMLPMVPGIELTPAMALVPVAGVGLFFRELMAGDASAAMGALTLGATVGWALLALRFATVSFGREEVLFGADEPGGASKARWRERFLRWGKRERDLPTPREAGLFVAGVAVLFILLGTAFAVAWGERGIFLTEWLLLLVPALAFVALGGYDVRRTLSLRSPSPRTLFAALLVIAGGAPVAWFLAWLQSFVLPVPWELLEQMEELLAAPDPGRLVWLLFLVALTPAVCEEAVFRGVLLGGTRGRMSPARFIVLNAVVFGAFHLSIETAFRFLPTAWLGLLLAWVVWRTGSIWTGVLMHFVNNASVVVLASVPWLAEWMGDDPGAAPPLWILPLALLLLAAGARLLPTPSPDR